LQVVRYLHIQRSRPVQIDRHENTLERYLTC
jgi:hypothetical protein